MILDWSHGVKNINVYGSKKIYMYLFVSGFKVQSISRKKTKTHPIWYRKSR